MLSIILLILLVAPYFFVWRFFAQLAHEHDRSRIGFAFLGLGVYFVSSQIIYGIILGLVLVATRIEMSMANMILMNIIGILFGAVCCWILYVLLKRAWAKNPKNNNSDLLDNLNK